ncbi:MAG TPA: hypothetical protein ENH10_06595 [Bacteroidetes bacterium]|nr:hypothetical protein BMS3Bbin04_00969 [bacterium BMS3Bbin04]HDO65686.1 hypothetical protein [Bacteroidota bacterium]HEX04811.1 hypothetical protein [Bacteroidota bacterium]
MTWEIRRIPLFPLMKVSFVVYLFLSLIVMLIYGLFIGSIAGMLSGLLAEEMNIQPLTRTALLIGGLFGSVLLSMFYTILTLIGGLIYNAVASLMGGLEIELEPSGEADESASLATPQIQPQIGAQPIEPAQPSARMQPAVEQQTAPTQQDQAGPDASTKSAENKRFMPGQDDPSSQSEEWGWGSGKEKDD